MQALAAIEPRLRSVLRPYSMSLVQNGFSDYHLMALSFGVAAFAGGLVALTGGHWTALVLLPIAILARSAIETVEDMMVREHARRSSPGVLLGDPALLAGEAVLLLPFSFVEEISGTLIVLIVISAILAELVGLMALAIGADRRQDGPLSRPVRMAIIASFAILLLAGLGGIWANLVLVIVLLLTFATIFLRARAALARAT